MFHGFQIHTHQSETLVDVIMQFSGDAGTFCCQANLDVAISKEFEVSWPHEKSDIEFRCELFNTFNHPQFSNPDANLSSATFGVITATSVNARVVQLALRLAF